jgi:hypothetical protein
MALVYLCYAAHEEDQPFIDKLRKELEQEHTVFPAPYDYTRLEHGFRPIEEERPTHILFVMSNEAYATAGCCSNLQYAINSNIPLIPVKWREIDVENRVATLYRQSADQALDWETYKQQVLSIHQRAGKINWVSFNSYFTSRTDADFQKDYRGVLEALVYDVKLFHAFISYSRKNARSVWAFQRQLEAKRQEVWIDTLDIRRGAQWLTAIQEAIEASDNCLIFVSNNWLGSDNCDDEIKHALAMHKRIIPVFLPEMDRDGNFALPHPDLAFQIYRERSEQGGWQNFQTYTPETVKQHFEGRLKTLEQYNPIILDENAFTLIEEGPVIHEAALSETVSTIVDRIQQDAAYVRDHTSYLLRALRHEKLRKSERGGDPLPFRELLHAAQWLWAGRKRVPPPTPQQKNYFRQSVQLYGIRLGIGFIAVMMILLVILNEQANTAQARADLAEQEVIAQQVLNEEINTRLQTLAQSSQQQFVDVDSRPRRPLLSGDSLWISHRGSGTLWRMSAEGKRTGEPISVGSDPDEPVTDGEFIWILSRGDRQVTRIDPAGVQPELKITVNAPDGLYPTETHLWIPSFVRTTLTQIDRKTGETAAVPLGFDERQIVVGGGYLWTWYGNTLRQIDATTRSEKTFAQRGEIRSAAFVDDTLWLAVETRLVKFNPAAPDQTSEVDLGFPFEMPLIAGNSLWVKTMGGIDEYDSASLTLRHQYPVNAANSLFSTPERLWVFTADNHAVSFDTTTGTQLHAVELTGAASIDRPVFDGTYLWVTPIGQGTAYVFDRDGRIYRQFSLCQDVIAPVFDGANMWFTCQGLNQLIGLPVYMRYFGIRNVRIDEDRHSPVVIGDQIWITQEQTGRIIVYSIPAQRETVVLTTENKLIPLTWDDPYLWTAVEPTGEVIRIEPGRFNSTSTSDFIKIEPTYRSIDRIEILSGKIWAVHNDPSPGPRVSLIDRDTVKVTAQPEIAFAVSGLTDFDDTIWTSAMTMQEGVIYKLSPEDGAMLETIDIPETKYGAWGGFPLNNRLWFSVVVPRVTEIVTYSVGMLDPEADHANTFFVQEFDPEKGEWGRKWWLPAPTTGPLWDGRRLWYNLLSTAPAFTTNEVGSEAAQIAIDLDTGEIVGPWFQCEYTDTVHNTPRFGSPSSMYLIGDLIWSGCLDRGGDVGVYSRISYERLHLHRGVGLRPNPPASDGEYVWMTFRDTGNAAVFDAKTGDLLRVFTVGDAPVAPVIAGDYVWIYRSGDDILQRLMLHPPKVRQ